MTKIDIISGFLGAGKTTFIKKLLEEAIAGEKVVLIENEFGEIGIDGGFLKDSGIEIREMNSGCICCSLVGDFGTSLAEVLTKYKPERIIIEPSGVGKLSDVMKAVVDVSADMDVELNSAVTIVDAAKCKMYMKNFGEFFNNQIENAGTIVLSRTDITDAAKVQKDVDMLREKNGAAVIITTPLSDLSGDQLLEIIGKHDTMLDDLLAEVRAERHHDDEECEGHHHHHDHEECGGHHHHDHEECEGHHHHDHDHHDHHGHDHHHHADEVFTSWGMETIVPVTYDQLEDVLKRLSTTKEFGDVLRAKGMLPTENPGEWLYFDLVPEQYEIREGRPDYTGKVCVIGAYVADELYGSAEKAYGETIKVNGYAFQIVGVVEQQDDDLEEGGTDDFLFMPYSCAIKMARNASINNYTFTIRDLSAATEGKTLIENFLYEKFKNEDLYTVTAMSEMLDSLNSMIAMVSAGLGGIAGISLLVAGVGVMNIMLVSVTERTREIGIRKALGAKRSVIMQQFVIEAAVTSSLGGVIGILLGSIATSTIGALAGLTATPTPMAVIVSFSVSVGIGLLFGYMPASRAAKLNPIDALRSE